VARHRALVISAIIVALAGVSELVSKTSAAAVSAIGAVASQQDLLIYLSGLSAVRASFAGGERVVVDGRYKLRQKSEVTVTLPTPAFARRAS
jgi:hypothetical protein